MNNKDILLAFIVLAAALLAGAAFWAKSADGGSYIEITVDGGLYGSYPLNQAREIVVESPYGSNKVVIENGEAFVSEADCPDKICVKTPPVSRDGEIICCLPHRMFVEVSGEKNAPYDALAE